jgi:hypothetical protein
MSSLSKIIIPLAFAVGINYAAYSQDKTNKSYLDFTEKELQEMIPSINENIPGYAKAAIGNEQINIFIGDSGLASIVTRHGLIENIQFAKTEDPTIDVYVSKKAMDEIMQGETGILDQLKNDEIKIKPYGAWKKIKIVSLKTIYALSGLDKKLREKQ